jgi:glycosyltransferase involved in cell wall biosynthesis
MKILHLVSCRGWSSDAYWAARISAELERAGHDVTLVCKRGSEDRVISRAREHGASRVETLGFASGMKPASDASDVRRLVRWLEQTDIIHVHRGKEHWLAVVANRVASRPRPLVRTRHIVQPIRAHALNRWLYRRATSLVVTVTEAIRQQYLAADLLPPDRVVALPGGVDVTRFHPRSDGAAVRRALGQPLEAPLVGLVSGFRVMKGHQVAIQAASRLAEGGRCFHMVFMGQGALESRVRQSIATAGLTSRISVFGVAPDLPAAMAAFDVALYPALESDGMSRVVFEYLAMGKPVVASRVGVVPEVLRDGETGLLVPPGEAGALAEALDRLLADPALRAELGRAGSELVRGRLSGAAVARELAAHYTRLLGRDSSVNEEAHAR